MTRREFVVLLGSAMTWPLAGPPGFPSARCRGAPAPIWRGQHPRRTTAADAAMGPKNPSSSVLTKEEAIVVASAPHTIAARRLPLRATMTLRDAAPAGLNFEGG
jgi:hypothetical protein